MRSVFPERPRLYHLRCTGCTLATLIVRNCAAIEASYSPFTSPFYTRLARLALQCNDVTQENAFQSSTFGFLLSLTDGVTVFTVNTQHSHADRNAINPHSGWIRFLTPRVMSRKRRRKSLRVIYETFGFKWMNLCQNRLKTIKLSELQHFPPLFTFDSGCFGPAFRLQSIKLQLVLEKCQFIVKQSMARIPPRHNLIIA
jgi:hypothetical protein